MLKTYKSSFSKQEYLLHEIIGDNQDFLNSLESLIEVYKEKKNNQFLVKIPVSLFSNNKLGIMEVLVRYLKENCLMNYSKIGKILNRDARTIWTIYQTSIKKSNIPFKNPNKGFYVPLEVFSNRTVSPLGSLISYLKEEYGISLKEISKILARDYRSVWLSYHNSAKKRLENPSKKNENEE
jgi:hypothetical protein